MFGQIFLEKRYVTTSRAVCFDRIYSVPGKDPNRFVGKGACVAGIVPVDPT